MADAVANFRGLSWPLICHHIYGTFMCCVAEVEPQYRGLGIALSTIFEVGSLLMNVADIWLPGHHLSKCVRVMHWTSIVPMIWVTTAALQFSPQSVEAFLLLFSAFVGGLLRVVFNAHL
tara:strand:+ start:310 stop:666 length:357 start_codon:yes stop_codon:yes gene_type:complete